MKCSGILQSSVSRTAERKETRFPSWVLPCLGNGCLPSGWTKSKVSEEQANPMWEMKAQVQPLSYQSGLATRPGEIKVCSAGPD